MRTLIEGIEGEPLDVGRATRSIPRAIRRALQARDHGCRFPGCPNTVWVDGHHIWHWIDGGPTRLSNLILLCRRHHTIVHDQHLNIRLLNAGADVIFTLPDGTRIHPAPPLPTAEGLDHLLAGTDLHPDQLGRWDGGPGDYSTAVAALQHAAHATAVA